MKAFQKYSKIGGIESLYHRYKLGLITLKSSAKKLNVAPETIRQNFIKLVGHERYLLDKENKKKRKFQTIKDGIDYLLKRQEDRLAGQFNIEIIISAFKHIDSKLRKDKAIDLSRLKSPYLTTKNGEKILIRTGKVTAFKSDYKTNYFRFNMSKKIVNYQYAIFVIFFQNSVFSYIFPNNEISHLRTLSLKYKDLDSNYKYKKALNNWKLIN